jgi:putative copper export protein
MAIDVGVIVRAAVLIALTAMAGGFAFNMLVMRGESVAALRTASAERRRRWLIVCLGATAVAMIFDAAAQMGRADEPARMALAIVVRAALLIALVLSLRGAWSESPLAIALCAGLLLTQSALGHAGREQEWVWPVLADWLHIGFVAIWLGGVAYFATVPVPIALARRPLIRELGLSIAKFSPLAILCVLVIGVTGIIQSASFVGSFEALVGTAYGRALLVKLLGSAVLIGFGAVHQFVIGPRLNAWRARAETQQAYAERFRVSVTLETGAGVVTLIAAAAMTVLPLARGA